MQTHEHRSHLVGWRFEYLIISSAKFKVVGLWQKEKRLFSGGCGCVSIFFFLIIIIKMCFFFIIGRSIGKIDGVVNGQNR